MIKIEKNDSKLWSSVTGKSPQYTVLGFIPSYDTEKYITVQFGHYCCLVTRAFLYPCRNLKMVLINGCSACKKLN